MIRWLGIGVLLLGVTGFTECYRPVGKGTGLPRHIRTLAILPLENPSLRFKVEQRLTAALVNETLRRSRSLLHHNILILLRSKGVDFIHGV